MNDGCILEGNWVNDELTGWGKKIYPDGRVYEGEFRKNIQHGNG